MKKRQAIFLALSIICLTLLLACGSATNITTDTENGVTADSEQISETTGTVPTVANPSPNYKINSFYELNSGSESVLSHGGESSYAALELDYRSLSQLGFRDLNTNTVYYPRLKMMADGRYILFYQEGEHGNTIYYKRSSDLVSWDKPAELFTYDKANDVMYATCDAAVLDNGDIIAVCAYRTGSDYDLTPEKNGIVMRKSSDNGTTWTDQKIIYVGTTWEPYVMQLSSGEVQVYFTNTTCYYKSAVADASTGTAMLRSYDRGDSWTGDISKPYSAQIVSQSKTRVSAGVQLFSDQMPVGIEMLGSGKLMLALETRLDKSGNYRITLSFSADNWKNPLASDAAGPNEKIANAWTGAAPYLVQFSSGEIVCAYTRQNLLAYRMIDSSGKVYSKTDTTPFAGISNSYWGSLELIGSHTLVGIGETFTQVTVTRKEYTLDYGRLNLNHRITARNMTPAVDGNAADWEENNEAVFIGSVSQAQSSVRCARDSENLYFLIERLDDYLNAGADTLSMYFASKGDNGYYRVTVGCNGVTQFEYFDGAKYTKLDAKNISFGSEINATPGYDADIDTGYCAEIGVALSEIDIESEMYLYISLANTDNNKKSERDVLDGMDMSDKGTWLKVAFE